MSYSDNNPLSALGDTNNSNNMFSSFRNMAGYSKEFLESKGWKKTETFNPGKELLKIEKIKNR